MRYFLTLLRAHLVCRLRSSAFWACALCFLLRAATLAAALPQENRLSLEVGLLPQGTWGEQVAGQLLSGEDFRYRRYTQRRELERDILTGTLHCGYLLEEGEVTALVTDGSYMRPLLDELVFTAARQTPPPTKRASRSRCGQEATCRANRPRAAAVIRMHSTSVNR